MGLEKRSWDSRIGFLVESLIYHHDLAPQPSLNSDIDIISEQQFLALLGLTKQQCEAIRIAGNRASADFVFKFVVSSKMQIRVANKLKA